MNAMESPLQHFKPVNTNISEEELTKLDEILKFYALFSSRSEIGRFAVRQLLEKIDEEIDQFKRTLPHITKRIAEKESSF